MSTQDIVASGMNFLLAFGALIAGSVFYGHRQRAIAALRHSMERRTMLSIWLVTIVMYSMLVMAAQTLYWQAYYVTYAAGMHAWAQAILNNQSLLSWFKGASGMLAILHLRATFELRFGERWGWMLAMGGLAVLLFAIGAAMPIIAFAINPLPPP